MIGVSLPLKTWLGGSRAKEEKLRDLAVLRESGAESVELRTVRVFYDPEIVLNAAKLVWDAGMQITVHGWVESAETAVRDVFHPLEPLLAELKQDSLTVTIHPICSDNAAVLTALSDHILERRLPVRIALENNRLMPDKVSEGDSTALVLDAVQRANRENVGICFDMGHFEYYRRKNRPGEPGLLPPKAFMDRVIHTHIHGVNGLKTHFPLGRYPLPLEEFLPAFEKSFHGVYNIELTADRFQDECDLMTALLESVGTLKAAMPLCILDRDDTRRHFDKYLTSASSVLRTDGPGTRFGLIQTTAYLFNTNGFAWGMDLAFREARLYPGLVRNPEKVLKDLKLILISHEHTDHFEPFAVKKLIPIGMTWLIPDFLTDQAKAYGIPGEKILIAQKDVPVKVGPLTILPFESHHRRPVSGAGVEEYGYLVTAEGSPSLVFPVDVRNYSEEGLSDPEGDVCFAHLWLGDNTALDERHEEKAASFARFMLQHSRKKILITHLYENGRDDRNMWRYENAEEAAGVIRALSPDTKVLIPRKGETMTL